MQCYVSFGSLLSESLIYNKLPTDAPCCKKIKEQHYTEQRIKRDCKLSWNIENCRDGYLAEEGFANFWKPCCTKWVVPDYKCEDTFLGMPNQFGFANISGLRDH